MAIYSGSGVITDSADGTFSDGSVETLKIGVPVSDIVVMQGTVAGFASGGIYGGALTQIDKFPFSISSGTATDVGDLSLARNSGAGHSSNTNGFTAGGQIPPSSSDVSSSQIDKFPFSISGGTGTDVGDLSEARYAAAPHSSPTDGFSSGGGLPPFTWGSTLDKYPFSISSGTATDIGDLSGSRRYVSGQATKTHAFASGGFVYTTTIDKFPFSQTSGTATDVGDLNNQNMAATGNSSDTNGFVSSGRDPTGNISAIDKFPFAISSGTATDIGDLTRSIQRAAGSSSEDDAFVFGGTLDFVPVSTVTIDKFPFAQTSGTSTDIGDLTGFGRDGPSGHQD